MPRSPGAVVEFDEHTGYRKRRGAVLAVDRESTSGRERQGDGNEGQGQRQLTNAKVN